MLKLDHLSCRIRCSWQSLFTTHNRCWRYLGWSIAIVSCIYIIFAGYVRYVVEISLPIALLFAFIDFGMSLFYFICTVPRQSLILWFCALAAVITISMKLTEHPEDKHISGILAGGYMMISAPVLWPFDHTVHRVKRTILLCALPLFLYKMSHILEGICTSDIGEEMVSLCRLFSYICAGVLFYMITLTLRTTGVSRITWYTGMVNGFMDDLPATSVCVP